MTNRGLEKEESWDFEGTERRGPASGRRAIVSVAFPSEDFALVSQAARESEKKLSEFIREAAVQKAAQPQAWGLTASRTYSLTTSPVMHHHSSETVVFGLQAEPILTAVT
jgi:hypothetical protein